MFDMHPMRVLFTIPKASSPTLKDSRWSSEFRDFVSKCLNKDADRRPTADALLQHDFLRKTVKESGGGNESRHAIQQLIERAREAKRLRTRPETFQSNVTEEGNQNGNEEGDETDGSDAADDPEDSSTVKRHATIRAGASPGKTPSISDHISHLSLATSSSSPLKESESKELGIGVDASPLRIPRPDANKSPPVRTNSNRSAASSSTEETKRTPTPSQAPRGVFKASRICRLGKRINCADYVGAVLLLGVDDGLFALDTSELSTNAGGAGPKLHPLSNRRYLQIDFIEEINTVVSRSGKQDIVCLHETNAGPLSLKQKFETETKLKKIKETKGCDMYRIGRGTNTITLCASINRTNCLVLRWINGGFVKLQVRIFFSLVDLQVTFQ
jgi:hypothetical protein